MSNTSGQSLTSASLYWGTALASLSLLIIGGGALIWNHRQAPEANSSVQAPPQEIPSDLPTVHAIALPAPVLEDQLGAGFHSVKHAVENGTPVIKIKIVADGDELVIDAGTGRLIETRPSRPTAPPPMGKFAAPFIPM